MATLTFREILQELNGSEFNSDRELQEAVRQVFNRRVLDFPPGYTHFDVIKRGLDNNWIEVQPNDKLIVHTERQPAALAR